jgi:hypothetical protein
LCKCDTETAWAHDFPHQAGKSRPTDVKNATGPRPLPAGQNEQTFKNRAAAFDRQKPPTVYLQFRILTLHVIDIRTGSPRSIGPPLQPRLGAPALWLTNC